MIVTLLGLEHTAPHKQRSNRARPPRSLPQTIDAAAFSGLGYSSLMSQNRDELCGNDGRLRVRRCDK